jgi:excisionase family DNA binding protein
MAEAFSTAGGDADRPIVSPEQLAEILGLKTKTVYVWIEKHRLDGSFRRRGKHILIWRDKAIDILFNGPEWEHKTKCKVTEKTEKSSATECGSTHAE